MRDARFISPAALLVFLAGAAVAGASVAFPPKRLEKNPPDLTVVVVAAVVVVDLVVVVGSATVGPVDGAHFARVYVHRAAYIKLFQAHQFLFARH